MGLVVDGIRFDGRFAVAVYDSRENTDSNPEFGDDGTIPWYDVLSCAALLDHSCPPWPGE